MEFTKAQLIAKCEHALEHGEPEADIDFYASVMRLLKGQEERGKTRAEWEHEVISRRPYCQICGALTDLQAHHIIPPNMYPGLKYRPTNGITLCARHHLMAHKIDLAWLMGGVTDD